MLVDEATRLAHAGSFDRAADVYDRSRPGYPVEAVTWLTGASSCDVLDLGAGAGALTKVLVSLGHRVVACDPSPAMLLRLRVGVRAGSADPDPVAAARPVPGVPLVRNSAEQLPYVDSAFDAVTVAQAFHWFDPARALPEVARVLKPGGVLGIVYNTRDKSEPWVKELGQLLRAAQPPGLTGDWGAGSVTALDGSDFFGPRDYHEVSWVKYVDRPGLLGLVESRSYVINLPPPERAALLERVAAVFDRESARSGVGSNGPLPLPYLTQGWRATAMNF